MLPSPPLPPPSPSGPSTAHGDMDYTATRRIQKLVTALTDPKATTLEPEKLAELKALLKANDELVTYTTPQLLDRLAANHAQASFSGGGGHPATTSC